MAPRNAGGLPRPPSSLLLHHQQLDTPPHQQACVSTGSLVCTAADTGGGTEYRAPTAAATAAAAAARCGEKAAAPPAVPPAAAPFAPPPADEIAGYDDPSTILVAPVTPGPAPHAGAGAAGAPPPDDADPGPPPRELSRKEPPLDGSSAGRCRSTELNCAPCLGVSVGRAAGGAPFSLLGGWSPLGREAARERPLLTPAPGGSSETLRIDAAGPPLLADDDSRSRGVAVARKTPEPPLSRLLLVAPPLGLGTVDARPGRYRSADDRARSDAVLGGGGGAASKMADGRDATSAREVESGRLQDPSPPSSLRLSAISTSTFVTADRSSFRPDTFHLVSSRRQHSE